MDVYEEMLFFPSLVVFLSSTNRLFSILSNKCNAERRENVSIAKEHVVRTTVDVQRCKIFLDALRLSYRQRLYNIKQKREQGKNIARQGKIFSYNQLYIHQ